MDIQNINTASVVVCIILSFATFCMFMWCRRMTKALLASVRVLQAIMATKSVAETLDKVVASMKAEESKDGDKT